MATSPVPTPQYSRSKSVEKLEFVEPPEDSDEDDNNDDEDYEDEPVKHVSTIQSPLNAIHSAVAGLNKVANASSAGSNALVDTASASKKRKHRATGAKRGNVSKQRKLVDYYVAVIRSQIMFGVDVSVIRTECTKLLKKHTEDDLTKILGETLKLNQLDTEATHTEAVNIMADATGDERGYYEELKGKSGIELQDEAVDNENKIELLTRMNHVIQYYIEQKNSNKMARAHLKRCVLESMHDDV